MVDGTVKWFNATKGFGFIEPEDGGKDAFVHISAVERAGIGTLNDGQKVTYELVSGRDGKEAAENIQLRDQCKAKILIQYFLNLDGEHPCSPFFISIFSFTKYLQFSCYNEI